MDVSSYEQKISLLSDSEKISYILNISDENTRFSLLKYLDNDSKKEQIIGMFSDEQLKVQALDEIKSNSTKVRIASTLTNLDFLI